MTDARKTILPPIGRIPPSVDAETKKFLGALKEHAEVIAGRRGDTTDRAVTHRDIEEAVAAAVAAQSGGSSTSAAKSLTTEDILALLEGAISSDELDEELSARLDTLADDTDAVSDTLEGNLEALSELAGSADKTIYFTGPETLATTTLTSFARTLIDDTTAADARTTLDAQQHDADLDAVAALTGYGVPTRQTDNSWVIDTTPVQNGFENRTDSTITFTDGTRTLAIDPVSANFVYWASGQKYTKTTSQTVTITDTEGLWYIYFVAGTLTASQTFSEAIITTHAFVATLYWDATNSTALFVGDERHGREMDSATHLYLHTTNGAQWRDGLAPNTVTADGSGNSDASAQIGVDAGSIADEDIVHSIAAKTFPAGIPFIYRSGAAGNWRALASSTYICTTTGTGRAAYNQNTGATWQLTEVASNNYVLMHLFATNATTDGLRWVVGQNEYATLAQAQDGADTEMSSLSLGQLDAFSAEFHPIATFILQTATGYTNAVKSRVRSTNSGGTHVDWRDPHTGGAAGAAGVGIPVGGTANQLLSKIDSTDYNTQWVSPGSSSGVQAWDADLDAIAALEGTTGFLTKTAPNTWAIDTSTYLTAEADTLATVTGRGATTTTPIVISANSASDALRITQEGAGNALLVEDSANPDATPFVVDGSGNVLVGIRTARSNLAGGVQTIHVQVEGTGFADSSLSLMRNTNATGGPALEFSKSRSTTTGGNGAVSSGDTLGSILASGTEGANPFRASQIIMEADAAPSTGVVPGRVRILTANASGTLTETFRTASDGKTTLTGTAVVTSNSAADALRITQTGAGNALVVEDSTNPDSTPTVIDATGRIITGYTAALSGSNASNPQLQVTGTTVSSSSLASNCFSATPTTTGVIQLNKSANATAGSHTIVTSGEALGYIWFSGSDGTNFIRGAQIVGSTDGTPTSGTMPGKLGFSTTASGSGTPTERVRIDSAGFTQIRSGTFGYASAVRGTVTQATSKATAVTLNKVCGQITTHAAALADATTVSFTVNNTVVEYNDVITLSICTGATTGAYFYWISSVGTGTFIISIRNVSGGSLSEAITFNFVVTKVEAPPFARVTTAGDARVTTDGSTRVVQ